MKHFINVILLVLALTALLLFLTDPPAWMPLAASAEAGPVDWLFGLHMDVIIFLYVLVNGVLLYAVVAFRRKPGDTGDGAYFHSNTRLEILWTVLPLAVVLYFSYLGLGVLRQTTAAAADELEVIVTARQWSWSFEYPDYGIAAGELNLPAGRKAHLVLRAEDVIHSFWVPEFRLKQDTVPGQEKYLRITPTEVGAYKVRCAELCGTGHAAMLAPVNVLPPAEFDIWVQKRLGTYVEPEGGAGEGPGEEDIVALGQQLAQANGCIACHSLDGSKLVGPSWKGVFGRTEALEDGSSITADEAYLRTAIIDPGSQIVAGFANLMPANYGDTLLPSEIDAIIAYLKTLE
ncbi:MAG: cytochrome c oxidase subunit II [Caldilineales bacterium]|nr:cytochrome c oxidase subunit II [Caldilineales bacterium]